MRRTKYTKIYNRFKGYTLSDLDCKYCLYYGGRKKGEVVCLTPECVCKEELREALKRERTENHGKIDGNTPAV